MKFQTISVNEIEKYLIKYEASLIDLRSREEYEKYHLEGAINIPYDDLKQNMEMFLKNKYYILYCERGGSSLMAAKELSSLGYYVLSVIGGISALE